MNNPKSPWRSTHLFTTSDNPLATAKLQKVGKPEKTIKEKLRELQDDKIKE